MNLPTFISELDLVWLAILCAFVFPGSIIATFLFLYNRAQEKREKFEREKKMELTNLKGRSNGVKHHVHE